LTPTPAGCLLMNLPAKVFIDTSFFIALLNSNDSDHPQAVALQTQLTAEKVYKVNDHHQRWWLELLHLEGALLLI